MKLMTKFAVIVCSTLLLTSCAKDARQVRITEKNRDTLLSDIKDMKGLTVGEVGLLMSAQMSDGFKRAVGGEPRKIVGMTVGELLVGLKKEAAEKEEQAKEEQSKEELTAAELRKAITLTVVSKGFETGDLFDYITFKVVYENTSGKEIRAFRGKILYTDLFGKEISDLEVTRSTPLKPGEKKTWDGGLRYNQFLQPHNVLRTTELSDMKVVWEPSSILFTDGTKMGEE